MDVEALVKGDGRVEFYNKDMKAMLEAKRRGSDIKIDIKI